jgi:F-type H+-transporting ATPase subunit b
MFVTTAYALSATAATDAAAPATSDAHNTATTAVHEVEHNAFPPFDPSHFPSQILWLAITFGIFYYLVAKHITPRLSGIIEARETRIASDLAEATRMKDEADAAIAKYEQELAEARAKGNAIATEARDKAKAEADAERNRLESALSRKIADAEASITEIKNKALSEVATVAEDTAAQIVQQLTGVSVTKADVKSAVGALKT